MALEGHMDAAKVGYQFPISIPILQNLGSLSGAEGSRFQGQSELHNKTLPQTKFEAQINSRSEIKPQKDLL